MRPTRRGASAAARRASPPPARSSACCSTLPWLAVYRVTFERPAFRARATEQGLRDGMRVVARHRTFMQLTAVYIMGRIAMDLAGALLILYVDLLAAAARRLRAR